MEDKRLCTRKKAKIITTSKANEKLLRKYNHVFCMRIKKIIWLETSDYKGIQILTNIKGTKYRCAYCYHDSANNKAPVKLTTQYRSINFNKEDLVANSQNPKDLINSFGIGGPSLTPWYPIRKVPPGFHILTGLATRCLQIEKAFVQSLSGKESQKFQMQIYFRSVVMKL